MSSDVIKFTGDWGDHLPVMEEAAKNNEFYHVELIRVEYEQLEAEGLEYLKTRCSETLSTKLYLAENHMGQEEFLIVLPFGE